MKNRELVMLAQPYDPARHSLAGMMVSEKLDGIRALWLPETVGKPIEEIGWANRMRDQRDHVCTGLWSRYGKVIHAPQWWLMNFPMIPLDGELYLGRKKFEETTSIVKTLIPDQRWKDIKFMVFDSPPYEEVYRAGKIYNVHYQTQFIGVIPNLIKDITCPNKRGFESTVNWLKRSYPQLTVVPQTMLPFKTADAEQTVEDLLASVVAGGGEGLMIRNPSSYWEPYRCHTLVKVKPSLDDEAIVVGHTDGKGKYRNMMGALVVSWKDKTFELGTGFKDNERAYGKEMFPVGTQVTFRYRELSSAGIPKEGRFLRKREAM